MPQGGTHRGHLIIETLAQFPSLQAWLGKHLDPLIEIRHDLHAHPELAMEEQRTAEFVARELRTLGLPTVDGLGGYGVVATIEGRHPGDAAIGLRADMDALPLHETTGVLHASTVPGRMHACGHDGHTTMLLGAARYLAETRDFAGKVHLIFQPAEESLSGAAAMIKDGLFDRFPCSAVYGLHNVPEIPIGTFAIRPQWMLAAADTWHVVFRGQGGHGGATPHLSQDVTYAQAQFVTGLQGIIGRNIAPTEAAVLSVGYLEAGVSGAPGIIPSEVRLEGTLRGYSNDVRRRLHVRLRELAGATAMAWGCREDVTIKTGIGALFNDPEQTRRCVAAAGDVVGPDRVNTTMLPMMASEDFASMLEVCRGAMICLGVGPAATDAPPSPPIHSPGYDFNDQAMPYGIAYWVRLAERELAPGRAQSQ